MDIRKFFSKAGASASKTKSSDAATSTTLRNRSQAEKKKARITIDDNESSEDDSAKVSPGKKSMSSPRKRKNNLSANGSSGGEISPKDISPDSATKRAKQSPLEGKSAGDLKDSKRKVVDTPSKSSPRKVKSPGVNEKSTQEEEKKKAASPKVSSASRTAKKAPQSQRDPPLQPKVCSYHFNASSAVPECLAGYSFVFSGVLSDLSRPEAEDIVKELGGRVTSAVSGKTDYLVVGDVLEDGRPYTEGSKYKRAIKEGTLIVKGTEALFGLMKQYDERARSNGVASPSERVEEFDGPRTSVTKPAVTKSALVQPHSLQSAPAKPANPYARAPKANPYARTNPYGKKPTSAAASPGVSIVAVEKATAAYSDKPNMLWVDKYKPRTSREILGNQASVSKLASWLASWEEKFNNSSNINKSFSNPNGPWKAALLSGPPGIGKTTTATLVAQESGRDVLEFNASDVRSKKALQEGLGDITGSQTLEFKHSSVKSKDPEQRKKRCIIMDEVDGMGAGDRSGMAELIQMIKRSRVPIICICNDRQSQKMKSLLPYCLDLRYRRPVKSVIANRALEVAAKEGLTVERNAAEAIAESCGNDVRQVLNCLQMWASNNSSKSTLSYKDLKERENAINKDEILRVSLFDAAKVIVEGRKGLVRADPSTERAHFLRRSDAYFVDYNFVGLLVQQNYLKIVQGQFNEAKRTNDQQKVFSVLSQMYDAAESMSDFAFVESGLRNDLNWSLLPFNAILAVKTGFHAGGQSGGILPGFPEFTTWLGRNSTKGKKTRILQELQHHMNYKISGGTSEMRLSYLPVFRDRFLSLLSSGTDPDLSEAIELMDAYGLDRDDVFENLDEFKLDSKSVGFGNIDSKKKAAFTRAYNQGPHRSQALVAEQGAGGKPKRKAAGVVEESLDLDAIDDDQIEPDEEEDEEDLNSEQIKAMFQKGRKGSAGAKGSKKVSGTSKSKKRR